MTPQLIISLSIYSAVSLLGLGIVLSMFGRHKAVKVTLPLYMLACLAFYAARAYVKGYIPFTEKIEAFVALSVMLVVCALVWRKKLSGKEFATLQVLSLAATCAVFILPDFVRYPPIYLHSIWYTLHIPLINAGYAFWLGTGVVALYSAPSWWRDDPALAVRSALLTDINRIGFILFTLALLLGGLWGYFCWGAYFMWDPKLHWSVILWLYYGNLLHIDRLPGISGWKIPLYIAGIALVLMTVIGTGFLAQTIHRV